MQTPYITNENNVKTKYITGQTTKVHNIMPMWQQTETIKDPLKLKGGNCKQQTASNTEDDMNKKLNHLQNSKQQKERNTFGCNTNAITMQQSA